MSRQLPQWQMVNINVPNLRSESSRLLQDVREEEVSQTAGGSANW